MLVKGMKGLGWPVEGLLYKGRAGGWAVLLEMPELAVTIGGVPPGFVLEEPSLYLLVISNTSQEVSAFSDSPYAEDLAMFLPKAQLLGYLWCYTKRFRSGGGMGVPCHPAPCTHHMCIPPFRPPSAASGNTPNLTPWASGMWSQRWMERRRPALLSLYCC